MNKLFSICLVIFSAFLSAETLFEVKDASNNKVLDVSTDGLRVLNGADTLMVISTTGIRAFIDDSKVLSRTFSVTTTSAKKGYKKIFEIQTGVGSTFFNPDDNTDEIFSINKGSITANVNQALGRDFLVNDDVISKANSNLMKVSSKSTAEAINDSTMLWYKEKNAFRVGHVYIATGGTNVGQGSFASGYRCTASGKYSTALGYYSQATNTNSFASGDGALASGMSSCAIGYDTEASASSAFAAGNNTEASGVNSCAIGGFARATNSYSIALGTGMTLSSGQGAVAIGSTAQATGDYSASMGTGTIASGSYATAIGRLTTAQAYNSFVIGRYNIVEGSTTTWSTLDPLFVIGNGTSTTDRSNAFEIQKNGRVFIPELPSTTSTNSKVYVQVDTLGKLCVPGKGEYPGSEEIDKLKEENNFLTKELEVQKARIAKLEEKLEKLLK